MAENSDTGTIEALSVDDAVEGLMQSLEDQAKPEEDTAKDDADEESDALELEADEDVEEDVEDGEEDEQADEDEEDESETTDDEDATLVYELDGEEFTVDELREFKKGAMMQADYTRKSQEVADSKRQIDAMQNELAQERAQLQEYVAALSIGTETETEPDWVELSKRVNVTELEQAKRDWAQGRAERDKQRQQATQLHQALQQQQYEETTKRESQALASYFPEWTDEKVYDEARAELQKTAAQFDVSPEEFAQVLDHRQYRILHALSEAQKKLAEYETAEKTVAKKVVKAKPRLPAGAKTSESKANKEMRRKKRDRFKSTGKLDDAVDYLMGEL